MSFVSRAPTVDPEDIMSLACNIDFTLSESLKNSPVLTIIVNSDGHITTFTSTEKFQFSIQPKAGDLMFLDFYHVNEKSMHLELSNCIKSGKKKEYVEQTTGSKIHLIVISPLDKGAVINIQDITERVRSENKLLEIEARFNALFDRTLYLIFLHDFNGNFIDANDAALKLMGYTRDELISLNVKDLLCEEYKNIAITALNDVIKTGLPKEPIEFKLKRKDGDFRWVISETCLIYNAGKPFAIQGIARDITPRKFTEASLNESEEKYRTLFENLNTGVCRNTGGPHGRFLYANPAMAKMLGYDSVEELMMLKVAEIYQNPKERIKFVDKVAKSGTVKWKELLLKKKDGTCITAVCTARAFYGENKDVKWIDILIDDISKQKKAEERLFQSYKNLRKTFTSTVQAMAMAIESRDPYTAGHQRRVAELAFLIATEMKFNPDKIDGIRLAGLVHDLGKITIPAEILSKPNQLNPIEFELIKNHCQIGYDILKSIEFPWPVAQIVYQHHERINGSGYPKGLSGDEILMESKIISVSDVVEAIATHRPYRATLGIEHALNEIKMNRGILYEPCVVDACINLFTEKDFKFNGN